MKSGLGFLAAVIGALIYYACKLSSKSFVGAVVEFIPLPLGEKESPVEYYQRALDEVERLVVEAASQVI